MRSIAFFPIVVIASPAFAGEDWSFAKFPEELAKLEEKRKAFLPEEQAVRAAKIFKGCTEIDVSAVRAMQRPKNQMPEFFGPTRPVTEAECESYPAGSWLRILAEGAIGRRTEAPAAPAPPKEEPGKKPDAKEEPGDPDRDGMDAVRKSVGDAIKKAAENMAGLEPELEIRSAAALDGHESTVTSLAYFPDGKRLASGGEDRTIRIWDVETRRCARILKGHSAEVTSIAISRDGSRLASGGGDGAVRIWDPAAAAPARAFEGHKGWVSSVAFLPDGSAVISAGEDGTCRVWDIAKGECARILTPKPAPAISALAVSPDGATAIAGTERSSLLAWDLKTGDLIRTIDGAHLPQVHAVAWAPDGRRFASAGDGALVKIWQARGRPLRSLDLDPVLVDSVRALAISPDGARILTADDRLDLRIWDIGSGKCLATSRKAHADTIAAVACSPEGAAIASAGWDKTIKLWTIEKIAAGKP